MLTNKRESNFADSCLNIVRPRGGSKNDLETLLYIGLWKYCLFNLFRNNIGLNVKVHKIKKKRKYIICFVLRSYSHRSLNVSTGTGQEKSEFSMCVHPEVLDEEIFSPCFVAV